MSAVLEVPREFLEPLAEFRFPTNVDAHLQRLMDRHTDGRLTSEEREELAALVDLSERLSLVRAEALRLLDRKPR